ncbi:MAG: TIGR02452 family protein [Schaedlerella sp.]|uniref:TIGR02452 family protein n=1 Tax=Schaedlerella sp. TaxID=2676057 RepID=UPI003526FA4E
MNSKKNQNIEIFQDTENLCRTNPRLLDAIQRSNAGQYMLAGEDKLEISSGSRYDRPCRIVVSKKRTLEAAGAYRGQRVCIHNFASATNPGGGVARGSNAQEEALCRCSSLYFHISEKDMVKSFHEQHRQMLRTEQMDARYNDDCIFTPGVTVFKTDTAQPERMPETDWYQVDVITCAAPNLREQPSNAMNPNSGKKPLRLSERELLELHIKRMRRILGIAKNEEEEVLILGAFGCGAFCNSPRVVAEAMARVVKEFECDFKTIEFAVYCSPRDTRNYEEFRRRLGK